MTPIEKAIRDFCGHHADWWPSASQVQAMLALAQTQEPLAWISTGPARMIHWTADKPAYGDDWVPLYTTPPQRKPLTDEQIIASNYPDGEENGPTIAAPDFELICFARQIEAAHGILEQGDKNE